MIFWRCANLFQTYPDDLERMNVERRREVFENYMGWAVYQHGAL